MSDIPRMLEAIPSRLQNGETVSESVRTVLGWFNAQRRGFQINEVIQDCLLRLKLKTNPSFDSAYIDALVAFELDLTCEVKAVSPGSADGVAEVFEDPTFRVSRLQAANVDVVSIGPQQSIEEVATLMHFRDFSQIPIISHKRKVHGAVSWRTLGRQFALGKPCANVMDVSEPVSVIPSSIALFKAVGLVYEHGYVLVKDEKDLISGIITTSDLSLVFRNLGEPFLLLAEIENFIRRIVSRRIKGTELEMLKDPADERRIVEKISDLTLGEMHRAFERPEIWHRLKLKIEKTVFLSDLGSICRIRNDVMHFDPDGIVEEQVRSLREFSNSLQGLFQYELFS